MRALRKSLSTDPTSFEVMDAGAGSKKLGNVRSVRSIYKTASCKGVYADLLYQLAVFYQPENILELGTSLGLGTIYLAEGNEHAQIISVDACKNTIEQAQNNLAKMQVDNVSLVNSTFESFLIGSSGKIFDMVYVDGHHEGKALLKYMDLLRSHSDENTIFVLDDIRWNEDMFMAWNELAGSEEFHLTMDLFRMGILVRRPYQMKEHFIIKLKNVLSGF